jgi:hypothetical protein
MSENPSGEEKDWSRRDILKWMAIGAAGVGAKMLVDVGKQNPIESKEYEKVGEAEITDMQSKGGGMGPEFDPINPGISFDRGGAIKSKVQPEKYKVTLKINGIEGELTVTKEAFDSYKVGQKVKVKYNDFTRQIILIEK